MRTYHKPVLLPVVYVYGEAAVLLGGLPCTREMMMARASQGCADHMCYISKVFTILTTEKSWKGEDGGPFCCKLAKL